MKYSKMRNNNFLIFLLLIQPTNTYFFLSFWLDFFLTYSSLDSEELELELELELEPLLSEDPLPPLPLQPA
jgi:hypothetical protein